MKSKNLIGQKFGKLIVISRAKNIKPKSNNGRSFTAWNCQCECGNILIIRTGTLINNEQKSCGCNISTHGNALKPNQKINKLTTISYDCGYWKCICECGNFANVLTHRLICGNTKSCGCLKTKAIKENQKLSLITITKYKPIIASARRRWKSYCYQDKNCAITFDEWFKLSQDNCYYCGTKPYKKFNAFLKKKSASQHSKDNGDFIYNGIDRIDSNLPHILNNVVTCCYICNRAKYDYDINEFYNYIDKLNIKHDFIKVTKLLDLPSNYLLASVKGAYRYYKNNYGDMEIDLQTFYTYSQLPCFYCERYKLNFLNIYLKDKKASEVAKSGANYYYNGIDRLDNLKNHNIDNIVPCCFQCNFAKGKLTLLEFQDWIRRVKEYRKIKCQKE